MKKILISIVVLSMFVICFTADASRIRVYYHVDGKISVDYPDLRISKKPDSMTMDQWIDAQLADSLASKPSLQGIDWEEMDTTDLPNGADSTDRTDRSRWRGNKLTGIRIDGGVVLRKDIDAQIDDELLKPNPDVIKLMRLQRKLDKREHD